MVRTIRALAPQYLMGAFVSRALHQNEIDSLLGFGDGGGGDSDSSGIRAIVDCALVSYERLPMLEVVFDRLVRMMSTILAQFHLGQCRGLDRQHHLDPLRRLPQLDPAAGDAQRVQGRGVGQLRPAHRRQRADLFDRRRAARRPPRHRRDAHRGPSLHDDRAQPRRAHGRGRARPTSRPPSIRCARHLPLRPARDQPALRHHRAGPPTPPCSRVCASTWKIAAAGSSCCCLTRPWSRSARSCCRCSWARSSAATRSGKRTLAGELWNTDVPIEAVLDTVEMSLRDVLELACRQPHPAQRAPQSPISS